VQLATDAIEADHALTAIARRFDVLLEVTPVNTDEAWEEWCRRRAAGSGGIDLRYRPPEVDPDEIRRAVDAVDVEVEDPALRSIFAGKAEELRRYAELVLHRGTDRFLEVSHALYDTADDTLLALAHELLDRLPPSEPDVAVVDPGTFAARAEAEIAAYRAASPGFAGSVQVRDDVPSLMVVQRELFVGDDSFIPVDRVEGLLHHEVGTHLLTAETGGRQPLQLLEQGLAHYEETQEALGLLSEHLVGGLDADRMRTLCGRAVAARSLSDGADFDEIVAELEARGIPTRPAWTIAVRIVRGGGFTKDVVYLRGLVDLVAHLAGGGSLDTLLVGKLHLRQVPEVEALLGQGVLRPADVRPRWLDAPGADDRLDAIRAGTSLIDSWV
jgi:uncharacterized protein (TIGR02421 family)